MEKIEIALWDKVPDSLEGVDTPNKMTFYPVATWHPLPAVVIFPGGGYAERAFHEGEPIAEYFRSRGFHAFVVHYRLQPYMYPAALQDAQRALKLVYAHANSWKIDTDMVFTLGFSAGGHLAGCTAVLEDVCPKGTGYEEISPKPTGAVLCYPVISTEALDDSEAHLCVRSLIRGTAVREDAISLEKQVNEKTAPCFLWATSDDETVSVSHSMKMGEALRACHIPFEMHIYPSGHHGLGLADVYPDVGGWKEEAVRWMQGFRR